MAKQGTQPPGAWNVRPPRALSASMSVSPRAARPGGRLAPASSISRGALESRRPRLSRGSCRIRPPVEKAQIKNPRFYDSASPEPEGESAAKPNVLAESRSRRQRRRAPLQMAGGIPPQPPVSQTHPQDSGIRVFLQSQWLRTLFNPALHTCKLEGRAMV